MPDGYDYMPVPDWAKNRITNNTNPVYDQSERLLDGEGMIVAQTSGKAFLGEVLNKGDRVYYKHGRIHRDDGPAIITVEGKERWYSMGIEYDKEDHPLQRKNKLSSQNKLSNAIKDDLNF